MVNAGRKSPNRGSLKIFLCDRGIENEEIVKTKINSNLDRKIVLI